jgi:hypothetical protein
MVLQTDLMVDIARLLRDSAPGFHRSVKTFSCAEKRNYHAGTYCYKARSKPANAQEGCSLTRKGDILRVDS